MSHVALHLRFPRLHFLSVPLFLKCRQQSNYTWRLPAPMPSFPVIEVLPSVLPSIGSQLQSDFLNRESIEPNSWCTLPLQFRVPRLRDWSLFRGNVSSTSSREFTLTCWRGLIHQRRETKKSTKHPNLDTNRQ
jgi:hypothetical protein